MAGARQAPAREPLVSFGQSSYPAAQPSYHGGGGGGAAQQYSGDSAGTSWGAPQPDPCSSHHHPPQQVITAPGRHGLLMCHRSQLCGQTDTRSQKCAQPAAFLHEPCAGWLCNFAGALTEPATERLPGSAQLRRVRGTAAGISGGSQSRQWWGLWQRAADGWR